MANNCKIEWRPMSEPLPPNTTVLLWFDAEEEIGTPALPQTSFVNRLGEIVYDEGQFGAYPYDWMKPTHWSVVPGPTTTSNESVIDEIAAEHRRQIDIEGFTADHDDEHTTGQMAAAASCYALIARSQDNGGHRRIFKPGNPPKGWPWHRDWWKPKSPRKDLIRAAALIVAEIKRLDRLNGNPDARPHNEVP